MTALLVMLAVAVFNGKGCDTDAQTDSSPVDGRTADYRVRLAAMPAEEELDGWLSRLDEVRTDARPEPGRVDALSTREQVQTLPAEAGTGISKDAGSAAAAFLEGYRAAGGPPQYEAHFVETVIPKCEWTAGWGVPWHDTGNGYVSVAQFTPCSWAKAGGGDPTDPWVTGRNVGTWAQMTVPGEQWPTCWWR